ncbi:MAG TPA: CheR family methyltransferase [Candidatus Sulfopaludibacter sp.]|nr:CheR family methyltransferase [Candidatus Sulfopaludibacter sp.]
MTQPDSPCMVDSASGPSGLSAAGFARLARFITGELGIKMPESKLTMVQSRLLRRVRELRLESVDQYAGYFFAADNASEREHFINAITTNKTDFFREPEHFAFLTGVVLPSMAGGARFQAWSAGCSSGEEPYTLAMVLAEYGSRHPGFDFAVLATDVSTRVLDSARAAIYPESQVAPIPPELRRKYLMCSRNRADQLARVVPELRRKVGFHQVNFMAEDYGVRLTFDAIFFRNVMIYFDRRTQEAVINRLCRNLAPGGYLFAGHSESLAGLDVPLKTVKAAIYRKLPGVGNR